MKLKHSEKRILTEKEKRFEKGLYRLVIGLAVFGVVYYYFIEPKTIGDDIRYSIYIFWLPTIAGLVLLAIYRRQFLIQKFRTNKGFILWTIMILFYLLEGFIFSYLSFGQAAKVSWDILNYSVTKQNQTEVLRCDVTRFWTGRKSNSIDFTFNGKHEEIKVQYKTIKKYLDENPDDYEVILEAQKGIWGYYTLNSWKLAKK